jgi:hypothetical protein
MSPKTNKLKKHMKKALIFFLFIITSFVSLYSQSSPFNNTYGEPIYIFSPGKYNMLDSPVNIRSQPNLMGSIIGRLELNSEIEIIEKTENSQTIEGMTHYWYKIKYGNITGYVWGGYISIKTSIFVLDNNTKIYCYYRYSKTDRRKTSEIYYHYFDLILPGDIFIYINQRRISNTVIKEVYFEETANTRWFVRDYWHFCYFYEEKGNIVLMINDGAGVVESSFIINKHGEIMHKKSFIINTD